MKVYQICFSPTGGTRRVAGLLCRGMGARPETIDLMRHVGPLFFSQEDLCVIAVPVYGGRAPQAALRGLRVMKGNGIPTVLVAVYGNRATEDTLLELRDETWACGFHCVAAVEAAAQHSLLPRLGAGRPDRADEEELMGFGRQILTKWESGDDSEPEKIPGRRPFREDRGIAMYPRANPRCGHCGLCARECPVQAIPRDELNKVDKRKCIACMHCVSVCPNHARSVNGLLVKATEHRLKECCTVRQPNRLYL